MPFKVGSPGPGRRKHGTLLPSCGLRQQNVAVCCPPVVPVAPADKPSSSCRSTHAPSVLSALES
uniref:Predicted gene 16253 n=1 Tax=Mus musculus TaxID=10090 RepID=D3Z167_MOUSE